MWLVTCGVTGVHCSHLDGQMRLVFRSFSQPRWKGKVMDPGASSVCVSRLSFDSVGETSDVGIDRIRNPDTQC